MEEDATGGEPPLVLGELQNLVGLAVPDGVERWLGRTHRQGWLPTVCRGVEEIGEMLHNAILG
jgi:hypothetical protein